MARYRAQAASIFLLNPLDRRTELLIRKIEAPQLDALAPNDLFISTAGGAVGSLALCAHNIARRRYFSNSIEAIKIRFVRIVEPTERRSVARTAEGERGIWQRRSWEHAIRMKVMMHTIWTIFPTTPLSTDMLRR